jgi:hypothetical protein
VDVDCHHINRNPEHVVAELEMDYFQSSIPTPNIIIFSGRGAVLIWMINAVTYKALPLWNSVQKYLFKQLEQFGADKKSLDAARVFRIAGSINSKSNKLVRVDYRQG